ncbi:MAG: hypothetical protein ACRCT7_12335 [Shewanella sp.]
MPLFAIQWFIVLFVLFAGQVHASVTIDDEIAVRETPQALYDNLNLQLNSDSKPLSLTRLSHRSWGLNQDALFRQYYLFIRLSMEPGVTVPSSHPDNSKLIEMLASFAKTPYQQAVIEVLKGRIIGKEQYNYPQVETHYQAALALIKENTSQEARLLRFTIHDHLGSLLLLTNQKQPSLQHLEAMRERALHLSSTYLLAYSNSRLGKFHTQFEQHRQALQYFSQAHQLASTTQSPKLLALINFRISKVYRELGQLEDALQHAHMAADSFMVLKDDAYLSQAMSAIAMIYAKQESWQQAIDYYLNAQAIDKRRQNIIFMALNYHNLGEAYANIGDLNASISSLLQANQTFTNKNTNHYLIHNEVLLAQVRNKQQNYQEAIKHANKAITLALESNNLEVEVEAKQHLILALERSGEITKALTLSKQVLVLNKQLIQQAKPHDDVNAALQQQRLKIELDTAKSRVAKQERNMHFAQIAALFSTLGLLTALLVLATIWRKHYLNAKQLSYLTRQALQEPITLYPGYNSFIANLENSWLSQPGTITLMTVQSNPNQDLLLGQEDFSHYFQQQLGELAALSELEIFALRPGLIGIYSQQVLTPDELVSIIEPAWTSAQKWSLGLVNLPFLANKDVPINAKTLYQCLQFACAGALSLQQHQAFVSFHTLDFTPPTIFTTQLYMRLTQAINRGLIRVTCSCDKQQITWPSSGAQSQSTE